MVKFGRDSVVAVVVVVLTFWKHHRENGSAGRGEKLRLARILLLAGVILAAQPA